MYTHRGKFLFLANPHNVILAFFGRDENKLRAIEHKDKINIFEF